VSLGLYMDVQVPAAITDALRVRGVNVLTSQEDGTRRWDDPDVLDRAGALDRVTFTRDDDYVIEAVRRQRSGQFFAGVAYAHQLWVSIRQCIDDLELIALASEPGEFHNRIEYLPLK
jgi:hypothetical protein